MNLKNSPLYLMAGTENQRLLADIVPGSLFADIIKCPLTEDHQRSGPRLTPLNLVVPDAAASNDFLSTWSSQWLIKKSVSQILHAKGLSGFELHSATVRTKRSGQVLDMCEFRVIGSAGVMPGARLIEHCPGCGHLHYLLPTDRDSLLDIAEWDGSDFSFIWPLPRYVLASERAVDVIVGSGLSGVAFRKDYPKFLEPPGASPGHPTYYLPQERATQLSARLGISCEPPRTSAGKSRVIQ